LKGERGGQGEEEKTSMELASQPQRRGPMEEIGWLKNLNTGNRNPRKGRPDSTFLAVGLVGGWGGFLGGVGGGVWGVAYRSGGEKSGEKC